VDLLERIIQLLSKLEGNEEGLKQEEGRLLKQESGKDERAEMQ
jgi:hypothetical protein